MRVAGEPDAAVLDALRERGLHTVAGAFAYSRGRDMTVPGLGHRERWSLSLPGPDGMPRTVYMKRYGREPLGARWRRLLAHGRGGSPASVELENIEALLSAGVPTIPWAVAGQEPGGSGRSYVLLAAVPGEALEQACEGFLSRHGVGGRRVAGFTRQLAELVRRFHATGLIHRDLYTSHVFLEETPEADHLRLIDLARAFRPRLRSFRWRVKDLAGLRYSMPDDWVGRHWDEFLGLYLGPEARDRDRWNAAVMRKAGRIARHDARIRQRRSGEGGA